MMSEAIRYNQAILFFTLKKGVSDEVFESNIFKGRNFERLHIYLLCILKLTTILTFRRKLTSEP